MDKIYEEGADRYKRRIPPGFEDEKDKKDKTKEYDGIVYLDEFGDLVVWKQIIDKAKNDQKPIIFVTDDVKEDWWQIEKGRTIGPRVELLNEFRREVDVPFYMYKSEQFISQIQLHLSEEVNEVAIKEIEDLREYSNSSETTEQEMTDEELELGLTTPEQSREFYKEYSEFLMYTIQEDLNRLKERYSPKEIALFYNSLMEEYNKLLQDKHFVDLGWLEPKEYTEKLVEFQNKVLVAIRNREAHALHKE